MTKHFCWWCGLYWVATWQKITPRMLEGPTRLCPKCRLRLKVGEVERRDPSMRFPSPPD